ncbi:penicillin-binding protein activator LpoB [Aliikangiella marina]|uniref:Penicillin-binding protein activator LpoB n=1 Tax=Aliikangiella marina TaxID=1712262 RepID=A0A545TC50_9GAMM|nr:penicillin-binding protein activator LpoB [Aliikangiella marina]TQV74784.1 penicillin-binding protein activator LpoB [Aliikangiella marina]
MKNIIQTFLAASFVTLIGCGGGSSVNYENERGRSTVYEDAGTTGRVAGVGIESQDIVSMTDQMMRDMLQNEMLMGRDTPPRIVIDAESFVNESMNRINLNMLTDRLRIQLNRAARGRLIFINNHVAGRIAKERELKRTGMTDGGTIRKTQAMAGVDFFLSGRITSQNAVDSNSGETSRFTQIIFEMTDAEAGFGIWGGMYDFKKTAQDNIIYR